ncbi:MAG: FAD:protein FMN transferase [Pseudomonadota bacterium]|nr:FAD:protein FMN transferase [Pseudomonadota bacterium]
MQKREYHKHAFHAMGSPCTLHLYLDPTAATDTVIQVVVGEVLRLEQKFSRYRDDSLAADIMQAAARGVSIELDAESAGLLDYAATLWQQSDGLFDITSGLLRRVWDLKSGRVPSEQAVSEILPHIGWDKLDWRNPVLGFPHAGMEVDFGGYVKEYAADSAAAVARQQGVEHGLIELGGDIRVIGPHPDGRPWQVGVRHPRQEGVVLAQVALEQGAVASSGDYERAMVVDGKRYGHILNPKTGWPVCGLMAVTVLAEHCLLAGTACTVAMLKGEQGPPWLDQLGLTWMAMDEHGAVLGNLV